MTVKTIEMPPVQPTVPPPEDRVARRVGQVTALQLPNWRVPSVIGSGHRFVSAYIGFWALLYDKLVVLARRGVRLAGLAERRGERVDDAVRHQVVHLEERAVDEVHRLQHELGHDVAQVQRELVEAGGELEDELEKRIAHIMANLGIPSRERLAWLNQELDRLNEKLDEELRRAQGAEPRGQAPAG